MTAAWLLLSLLAAIGFYLASPHQRLWPRSRPQQNLLRIGAWTGTTAATVTAVAALGPWAGVFSAMTSLMLVLVVLPYLDAWLHLRKEHRRVG